MLASHDWRHRHAGLMAIAALGEGTANVSPSNTSVLPRKTQLDYAYQVMKNELGKVVQ
jgi:hypothetical protein